MEHIVAAVMQGGEGDNNAPASVATTAEPFPPFPQAPQPTTPVGATCTSDCQDGEGNIHFNFTKMVYSLLSLLVAGVISTITILLARGA